MTALMELRSVSARRGATPVLHDVTLSVASGEVLALLGPSGAGKSSLLRLLLGLSAPDRGEVRLRGRVASSAGRLHVPPEARELAVVFQDLALWPHLTVDGNLRFVLRSRGVARDEEDGRIAEMLNQVDLGQLRGRYPGELSGGEQQRLAIARALVVQPAALLLDEPLANLDVLTKRELLQLFGELFSARGLTVLHVTHDPREAASLTSNVAVLEAGRITYRGDLDGLAGATSAFALAVADALSSGSR